MKKHEGFEGQKSIVLPGFITSELANDPITSRLFISDIGFYPYAQFHYRRRPKGIDQYILIYCVKGKGWVSVQQQMRPIQENDFFIIPAGVPHSYGSDKKSPWSIYWLHFSGKDVEYFRSKMNQVHTIEPSKDSRFEDRLQLFNEIFRNLEMGYSKENLAYACICLWHFMASLKFIGQFRHTKAIPDGDIIEASILYMKQNLSRKVSLEDLAKTSNLSISHYSYLFKEKTSRSPMDYLTFLRIQGACQYLDFSSLRINEISAKLGYDDPYYFSRIFKKVMGVSPVFYRKLEKA